MAPDEREEPNQPGNEDENELEDDLEEEEGEDDEEDGEEFDEPPYMTMVLFREFPSLDSETLRQSLNSLEPSEETCQVSEFTVGVLEADSQAAELLGPECIGRRTAAGVIAWGDLQLAVIVHDWPAPREPLQFAAAAGASLPAVTEAVEEHKAYALLTCLDAGGEMHPVERVILMIKTAIAMAEQGALAAANDYNATFFPAELLLQLGDAARESISAAAGEPGESYDPSSANGHDESPDAEKDEDEEDEDDEGEEMTLWDSLRAEGIPAEILVSLVPVEDPDGQLWFVTRGHALCELPELAYKAEDISEYEDIDGHFKNAFSYMMENGPVLEPGHTLGYDEDALMRFTEPDPEEDFLESPYGTLIVTLEEQ